MKNIHFAALCFLGCTLSALAQMPPPQDDMLKPPPPGAPYAHRPGDFKRPPIGEREWGRGEQIVVTMEKLKTEKPDEYAKLEALRKTDIRSFMKAIKPYLPKDDSRHHRMGQIEAESRRLAEAIKKEKDPAAKSKLEAELKAKILEGFNFMLEDATKRMERMQKFLDSMRANKDIILEERFQGYLNLEEP